MIWQGTLKNFVKTHEFGTKVHYTTSVCNEFTKYIHYTHFDILNLCNLTKKYQSQLILSGNRPKILNLKQSKNSLTYCFQKIFKTLTEKQSYLHLFDQIKTCFTFDKLRRPSFFNRPHFLVLQIHPGLNSTTFALLGKNQKQSIYDQRTEA